ncbi:MFS transporter [Aliagarivorans marinus]|uniref:MFS transporter n=1 Tax=Aliagarivorans marinus TaxID=561965 RepID=UPI0004126B29|nr:MFS transporter [Aliagarivorans marinus]
MSTHTLAMTKEKSPTLVVFSAGAFFFYSFIQMTLLGTETMKAFFMDNLALSSAAEFGNFAGAFLYGTVLMLIPAGVILDKYSVKKSLLATLLLMIACSFGLSITTDVFSASLLRFLMGAAHCIAFMAPFRLAPRWFPSEKLALVAGSLVAFAVFGGFVSGAPLLAIINATSVQIAMVLNTLLGGIILLMVLLFVQDSPDGEVEAQGLQISLIEGLKLAAKNKQNWLAGTFIGMLNLSVLLLGAVWGTTYLRFINPEFTEATYTGIIGMIFIGTMLGSPVTGLISDKLQSRKKAMLGGAIISLAIMLLIMFPPSTSAGFFYVMFLLLGILTSAQSIGYPVIGESNQDKVLGTANGLSAVILMGIGAIGQPFFGKLVSSFGGTSSASPLQMQAALQSAIWIMPIAFVISIVCVLFLDETFNHNH